MNRQMLQGIMPAAVTPLRGDGRLDGDVFERLLGAFYRAGCSGVYVCGQTGEGLSLPASVRKAALEVAVACSPGDRAVVAHIGAGVTADAVELARHASRCGAHAISSLPPGNAYSFAELRAYYEAIAAAADVPVLVYYFPEFSRSVSSLEQIFDLCSIPGVVGLKFTDFDLYRVSLIQRAGHVIFNGRDEVLAAGLLMGAHGGIGSFYNLVPELFVDLFGHAQAGRWAQARAVQDRINDLIRTVLRFPMLPAIKHLLTRSGFPSGAAVLPRRRLREDEAGALERAVGEAGFEAAEFLAQP
jgi:N-acetylneuraminate lyase